MTTATFLTPGVDILTRLQVFQKALEYKELSLAQDETKCILSTPIREYTLDSNILEILAGAGIVRQFRPDCGETIFTLVDTNSERNNYWNFPLIKGMSSYDLRISLRVRIEIAPSGIAYIPQAFSPAVSPGNQASHKILFKVLTSLDVFTSQFARDVAKANDALLVPWSHMKLEGIKSLADLFNQFANNNKNVLKLKSSDIFDPIPVKQGANLVDAEFVTQAAQQMILEVWSMQLEAYRESLAI